MAYVEVHPADNDAFRLVVPGADQEPIVTNPALVNAVLGTLGVRSTGPWEVVTADDGHEYRRALLVT